MAVTTEAAALTAASQRAQLINAAIVIALTQRMWSAQVKKESLFETAARLAEVLLPIIMRQRSTSELIARQYYLAFRQLELGRPNDDFQLPGIDPLDPEAIRTSLRVTGPIALQRRLNQIAARDLDPAVERSLVAEAERLTMDEVSEALGRHVMNGGRDQIQEAVDNDPVALGFFRTTSADPCFFCAMLASRGPAYKGDSFDDSDPRFTGPGDVKVHDHCTCGFEPIFDRKTKLPAQTTEFESLWIRLSEDLGRAPSILDWRQAYQARSAE